MNNNRIEKGRNNRSNSLERNEQHHQKGTRKSLMKLKQSIIKLKVQTGRKE